jgi:protein involved in polysaccharide export with SLBB domain
MKYRFYPKAFVLFNLALGLLLTAFPIGLSGQTAEPQAAATSSEDQESTGSDVLKVNDLVRVTVYKEDDMLTEARISKAGNITLPLLGLVHVEGKTVAEATADIRARLDKDYIINPQVSLIVLEYASQWVTVLGQVQHPSQVPLPPEGGLDLMGAIALAGGFTRIADPSKIIIRRIVNSRDVVLKVDARKLAGDSNSPAFMVLPGDTISVGESLW